MVAAMAGVPIADLIDGLLAAPKSLGGTPTWRDMGHHDQHRAVMPVLIGGESSGLLFEVCAYPNTQPVRFTISLRMTTCVWRLDFSDTDIHTNPLLPPSDIAGLQMIGRHYHRWSDNRHLATNNKLPNQLSFGRPFDLEINDFEGCLVWFCEQTGIDLPPERRITLPERTKLF